MHRERANSRQVRQTPGSPRNDSAMASAKALLGGLLLLVAATLVFGSRACALPDGLVVTLRQGEGAGASRVNAVAFSPDARILASAHDDGLVRLWDVALREQVASIRVSDSWAVTSVVFSPDGRRIACACMCDSCVYSSIFVLTSTGEPTGTPIEVEGAVNSLAFSSDGTELLVAPLSGPAQLLDSDTGLVLAVFGCPQGVYSQYADAAFSPDERYVVTECCGLDAAVCIWDVQSRNRSQTFGSADHRPVNSVSFSPDGRCVASASDDDSLRIWDIASGDCVGALESVFGGGDFERVCWSGPDVLVAIVEGVDCLIWDTTRQSYWLFRELIEGDWTTSLAVEPVRPELPMGRLVAVGTGDGRVCLLDIDAIRDALPPPAAVFTWEAVSADAVDPGVGIWAPSDADCEQVVELDASASRCQGGEAVEYRWAIGGPVADGRYTHFEDWGWTYLIPSTDGAVAAFTLCRNKEYVARLEVEDAYGVVAMQEQLVRPQAGSDEVPLSQPATLHQDDVVQAAAFSPDGQLLAIGATDPSEWGGEVRIWALAKGQDRRIGEVDEPVTAVAFAPSGKVLAASCGFGVLSDRLYVRTWDAESGAVEDDLELEWTVFCMAFCPTDGDMLACGTANGIELWAVRERSKLRSAETYLPPSSIVFSPDGLRVACCLIDGAVVAFDVRTLESEVLVPPDPEGRLATSLISPDWSIAAVSPHASSTDWRSQPEIVALRQISSGANLHELAGHSGAAVGFAFDSQGRQFATGSLDEIKIWDVLTGAEVAAREGRTSGYVLFQPGSSVVVAFRESEVGGSDILCWDYSLSLQGTPTYSDEWDGDDSDSDGATRLDTSTEGWHGPHVIGGDDEDDWFMTYLRGGATYYFSASEAASPLPATLYVSCCPDVECTPGEPGYLEEHVEDLRAGMAYTARSSGYYYLQLERGASTLYNYNLHYGFAPASSAGDLGDPQDNVPARAVLLGAPEYGAQILTQRTVGGHNQCGPFGAADPADWYRVNLSAGASYKFILKSSRLLPSGASGVVRCLLYPSDDPFHVVSASSEGEDPSICTLTYSPRASGSYYVCVLPEPNWAPMGYELTYEQSQDGSSPPSSDQGDQGVDSGDPEDDYSVGATRLAAPSTELQSTGPHAVGSREENGGTDSADWFSIELQGGRAYRFEVEAPPASARVRLWDSLWDPCWVAFLPEELPVAARSLAEAVYDEASDCYVIEISCIRGGLFYLDVSTLGSGESNVYTLDYLDVGPAGAVSDELIHGLTVTLREGRPAVYGGGAPQFTLEELHIGGNTPTAGLTSVCLEEMHEGGGYVGVSATLSGYFTGARDISQAAADQLQSEFRQLDDRWVAVLFRFGVSITEQIPSIFGPSSKEIAYVQFHHVVLRDGTVLKRALGDLECPGIEYDSATPGATVAEALEATCLDAAPVLCMSPDLDGARVRAFVTLGVSVLLDNCLTIEATASIDSLWRPLYETSWYSSWVQIRSGN